MGWHSISLGFLPSNVRSLGLLMFIFSLRLSERLCSNFSLQVAMLDNAIPLDSQVCSVGRGGDSQPAAMQLMMFSF